MIKKFICKKCGECCKEYQMDKEGNKELDCLYLYEWEVKELKEIAKERGIKINIKPLEPIFDEKSKLIFTILYGLYNTPCPFFINNECSIYEKRPLICKYYPLGRGNYDTSESKILIDNCPNNKLKEEDIKEYEERIEEIYGDCYKFLDINNKIQFFIIESIKRYKELGEMETRKPTPRDFIHHNTISFFNFLIRTNKMKEEGRDKFFTMIQEMEK